MSHSQLEKIKCALEKLLPRTIQVYNLVVLELSGDGIEREIIANDDITEDKIAILTNNKIESPKNIFTMFCTDNCKDILKGFLKERIDWSVKTEFAVSKFSHPQDCMQRISFLLQGVNDIHTELIRDLSHSRYDNDFIFTVIHQFTIKAPAIRKFQDCHFYYVWPGQGINTEDTKCVNKSSSDSFRLETLGIEWLSLLVSTWKFSDELTEQKMRKLFALQRVFGIFIENHQEPVSWVVLTR